MTKFAAIKYLEDMQSNLLSAMCILHETNHDEILKKHSALEFAIHFLEEKVK